MTYHVEIRKNETGEIRLYKMDGCEWSESDFGWWSRWNGNFGCDCNRYTSFERAAGHEPTDEEEELYGFCGHERYEVLCAILTDGTRIPIDGVSPSGTALRST